MHLPNIFSLKELIFFIPIFPCQVEAFKFYKIPFIYLKLFPEQYILECFLYFPSNSWSFRSFINIFDSLGVDFCAGCKILTISFFFFFFTGYPVWAVLSEEAVFSPKYTFGILFRNPVCVVVCVYVWSTLFHPCTCFCASIMPYYYRKVVKLEIRYSDTPRSRFFCPKISLVVSDTNYLLLKFMT